MAEIKVTLAEGNGDTPGGGEQDIDVPDTGIFTMVGVDGSGTQEGYQEIVIGLAGIILAVLIGLFAVKLYNNSHRVYIGNKYGYGTFHINRRFRTMAVLLPAILSLFGVGTMLVGRYVSGNGESLAAGDKLTVSFSDVEISANISDVDTFAVKSSVVKVVEPTPAGYMLSVYADNADLVNTDTKSESRIAGLASGALSTVALNVNTWGIATEEPKNGVNSEVWNGVPARGEAAAKIIRRVHEATPANDETTVYYGINVNNDLDIGVYTGTINYTAVAYIDTGEKTYTIRYEANNGSGESTTQKGIKIGAPVTLMNNQFTNDGYVFVGWGENETAEFANYSGGEVVTNGLTNTPDSTVVLYAIWRKEINSINDIRYMQDFATLSEEQRTKVIASMVEDTEYSLKDIRQHVWYNIAKLKDGKIWMTSNLRLKAGESVGEKLSDLTAENTNISGLISALTVKEWNDNLSVSGSSTGRTFTEGQLIDYNIGQGDNSVYTSFFNYCAMTGGEICSKTSSNNASQDLCPTGWRLPTGGSGGEFEALYGSYGSFANLVKPVSEGGANIILSGDIRRVSVINDENVMVYDTVLDSVDKVGYYWSSTNASDEEAYILHLERVTDENENITEVVDAVGKEDRTGIFSARCVLK